MKYPSLLLITGYLLFASCTATKPLTSTVAPAEVTDLKLMEPCSYISMIRKGNKGALDDSISAISKQLNTDVLKGMAGQIPITGNIILSDSAINKKLENEYEKLILTADRKSSIADLAITPTLDQILEANETRFGMIVVASGFTRVKGNYGKEIAKGAALGILTLGMYYQTPIKAYSTIYVMIVDSRDNNVAFFRKSYLQDREPIDESVLVKQYNKIFEGYFLAKQ